MNPPGCRSDSLNATERAEKATRFGCGFLFGVVFGGFAAARLFYENGFVVLAATALVSTFLGLAAVQFGDRFWLSLKHWIWWLS